MGGDLYFSAGDTLDILVGGPGESGARGNGYGGGGGGGSFVFDGALLFAAGGGAGSVWNSVSVGGNPGIGSGGYPAGQASYGGGGGGGVANGPPFGQAPPDQQPAQSGSFPNGGAGACCFFLGGPSGGYGGGGGGGYNGGGGGGGAPGGAAGQGGYSYVIKTALDAFGITGGNSGVNGYVSIDFIGSSVPEASTWAMMLTGFSALGGMLLRRGRKGITPA